LTDAQAAFIEPVSCVVHALNRLRVWPGDEVLILGGGPMGLALVQALCHSGASQVVVVEPQPNRLAEGTFTSVLSLLPDLPWPIATPHALRQARLPRPHRASRRRFD
jgi:hypothetical protein